MPKDFNDIIPPSRRRTLSPEGGNTTLIQDTPVTPPPSWNKPTTSKSPRSGRRFPIGTAVIALVVIILSGVALYAFAGAKVTITPAINAATVSGDFTATAGSGDLSYEVVSVDKVASQTVASESTENVNQSAQGSITISNQQAAPQTLITNTRFATPAGLVFRIHSGVTVPAAKNGNPGTLTVTVYADQAGDKYNVGPSTFTLPGLSGSKAFDLVTAKSTAAMTGGFSGTRATVSQATRDAQTKSIQSALAPDLATALKAKIPAGYITVPGSTLTTYTQQPDVPADGGKVTISEKGTVSAAIFPEDALAKAIAYKVVGTYAGQPVTLSGTDSLTLAVATGTPPDGQNDFTFTLGGTTTIVWKVDAGKIAGAVAGKTRDSAQVVLSGFPEVDKATLVLRPFWTSTFPADPAHITVTVTNPTTAK